jgi:ribosomal protein L14
MKTENYSIKLEDNTCVIITNKKNDQYGCVIRKEDAEKK